MFLYDLRALHKTGDYKELYAYFAPPPCLAKNSRYIFKPPPYSLDPLTIMVRCHRKKVLCKLVLPSTYFLGNKYSPVLISQEISTPGSTFFLGNKYSLGKKVLPYIAATFQFLMTMDLKIWTGYTLSIVNCLIV